MKSVIKIVKKTEASQPSQREEKRERTSEREIAITIKSWISERQQQRRMSESSNWRILTKFAQ
jgi:hypothetical protein